MTMHTAVNAQIGMVRRFVLTVENPKSLTKIGRKLLKAARLKFVAQYKPALSG